MRVSHPIQIEVGILISLLSWVLLGLALSTPKNQYQWVKEEIATFADKPLGNDLPEDTSGLWLVRWTFGGASIWTSLVGVVLFRKSTFPVVAILYGLPLTVALVGLVIWS